MFNDKIASDIIWWQQTFGPSYLVRLAASLMNEGRVVIIQIDKNTAFKHEMREAVIKYYQDNYCPSFKSETFDCAEILSEKDDFSAEIIVSFSGGEEPLLLKGETVVDYAVRGRLFSDKILWFKGIESKKIFEQVLNLAAQYNKKGKKDSGILVLEVPREFVGSGCGNLKKMDTANLISETDTETFALNIYRSKNEHIGQYSPYLLNKYVSVLVTCLCGKNAELAEKLIKEVELVSDDVFEDVKNVIGGYIEEKEIGKRIWEAQLKTFFPLVEERKLFFVKKYESFFRKRMTMLNLKDKITKELISNPYDLEIGQLNFCLGKNLSEVTQSDKNEIELLCKVRNVLAHLEILDGQKIEKLIEISDR